MPNKFLSYCNVFLFPSVFTRKEAERNKLKQICSKQNYNGKRGDSKWKHKWKQYEHMYRHQTFQRQLILPLVTNNLHTDSFMTSTQYYIKYHSKASIPSPTCWGTGIIRGTQLQYAKLCILEVSFYKLLSVKWLTGPNPSSENSSLSCLIMGSSVYYLFLFGLKTKPPLQGTSKAFLTENPIFWIYLLVAIPGVC